MEKSSQTREYAFGKFLVKISKLQRALTIVQEKAMAAREAGDWQEFAYHTFYFGRLCQRLQDYKNEHNLDVEIPEPADPRKKLPAFISRSTTSEFPELRGEISCAVAHCSMNESPDNPVAR